MRRPPQPTPAVLAGALPWRLLLTAVLLACPAAAYSEIAYLQASGGAGFGLADQAEIGPTGFARLSLGLTPQVGVGAVVAASSHPVEDTSVRLEQAGLEAEWRLDVLPVIPSVHLGLDALRPVTPGSAGDLRLAFHLGLAVDWWPRAPYAGPSLGLEVRYLALPESAFPLTSTFSVRLGWGF